MSVNELTEYAEVEPVGFVAGAEDGRKAEILAAAADVFVERGYDAGTMREIAARVGVTEPALYRHFPGKEAIFLALLRAVGGRVRAEALALISRIRAETVREQLIVVFADRRKAIARYAPLLRMIASASTHHTHFLEEYRRVMIEPTRVRLAEKAAELDAAFSVPDADASRPERVRALMALFVGFFVSSLVLADEPDEAIADAVLRVMRWER